MSMQHTPEICLFLIKVAIFRLKSLACLLFAQSHSPRVCVTEL